MIFPPHNKDCALFDGRIGGQYYALHRPSSPGLGGNYIWLAESPDLVHWGNHRCLAHISAGHVGQRPCRRRGGADPHAGRLAGNLPRGHGRDIATASGACCWISNEPWKVLARSREPIMEPLADYEHTGFFGNVVFTNGHLVDGDTVTIYYGASDSVICGARFSMREILDTLR